MDEFEIPADVNALDADALTDAQQKALAEEQALLANADITDDQLDRVDALRAFRQAARQVATERETAAQSRAERIAAARQAADEAAREAEPAEPEAQEQEAENVEQEKEPVAASAVTASAPAPRRSAVARATATAHVATPPPAAPVRASIVAAADAVGLPTGKAIDSLSDLVPAALKRFQAMTAPPRGRTSGVQVHYGLASIELARTDGLSDTNPEYQTLGELVAAASDERRLPGGSLTAAAGWCAPSETLYDLADTLESTDGIWDVPSINVTRGGINFTKGPDIRNVFGHAGFFSYTEAQIEAGVTKPCFTVPCPDFTEVRLDAIGLCIKAGILQRAGFPEIIRKYIDLSLIANQHQIAASLLAKAQTIAGATTTFANVFENTSSVVTALELVAVGEREAQRTRMNQTFELVAPHWLRSAFRADFAAKQGVAPEAISDAQINAWFAIRGYRVQWVYNYQPLTRNAAGVVVDWPTTVEFLIYPAGAFVKGTNDLVNLEAVYDSTDLRSNEYTALFAEEAVFLANTAHTPRRITVPLIVSGRAGGSILPRDWGAASA